MPCKVSTQDLIELLSPLAGKRVSRAAINRLLYQLLPRGVSPKTVINLLYYRGLICVHNAAITIPPWWSNPRIVHTLVGDHLEITNDDVEGYAIAKLSLRNYT